MNQGVQIRRIDRTTKSDPLVLLIWVHVKEVFRLHQRTYIMSWNHDSTCHHLTNWQDQHSSFILKVYFNFLFICINFSSFLLQICVSTFPSCTKTVFQPLFLISGITTWTNEGLQREGCSVEDPGAVSQVGKNDGGKKKEDNTLRDLHNFSGDPKGEFNNCFIFHLK